MKIYPHKAQYRPGEGIELWVEAPPGTARVEAILWDLYEAVAVLSAEAGEPLSWKAPDCQWAAFGVEGRALDGSGNVLAEAQTAFDVADHWYRAPRMGFVTDFSAGETLTETERRIDLLTRMHMNCLHFYDWFYTHHSYLPPSENFVDSMGRELSSIAVRRKIRFAKRAGMAALAYGPLYGAEWAFVKDHPEWALYRSDSVPFNVASLFYIMDFRPESPWTAHILREYAQAVAELGFDGIQIDQYGYPKRALPYPGHLGQPSLDLSDLFLPFIEMAHNTVSQINPEARVIFHAVNNWPLRKVAGGPQVANYIQVFAPHETYRDLRDLVAGARALAPETPVILAAYLKPFLHEAPARAEAALRLLNAVIHAAGGYQVSLGEGDGVLTEGYYPNYARLTPQGLEVMQRYSDFMVRYGPLLHAPPEVDVSETHGGGVTAVYEFEGAPHSPLPDARTVWTVIREHPGLISINLINLTGTATGRWNEGQDPPPLVAALTVTCKVLEPIEAVYMASPDRDGGRLIPLPFVFEPDPHTGHILRFVVTDLAYWSLVLIKPQ